MQVPGGAPRFLGCANNGRAVTASRLQDFLKSRARLEEQLQCRHTVLGCGTGAAPHARSAVRQLEDVPRTPPGTRWEGVRAVGPAPLKAPSTSVARAHTLPSTFPSSRPPRGRHPTRNPPWFLQTPVPAEAFLRVLLRLTKPWKRIICVSTVVVDRLCHMFQQVLPGVEAQLLTPKEEP